jgi:hypothetical protein
MACCSGRVPGIAAPKETVLLPGRSRPKPLTLPDNGPLRPRSWHFHGVAVLERRVERIAEPGMAEEGVTGRNFSRD